MHAPCPGKWTSTVTARCRSTAGRARSASRGPPRRVRVGVRCPVLPGGRCPPPSAGRRTAGWRAAAGCTLSVAGVAARGSRGFGPRPLRTGRRRGRVIPAAPGGVSGLPLLPESQRKRSRGSRKRAAARPGNGSWAHRAAAHSHACRAGSARPTCASPPCCRLCPGALGVAARVAPVDCSRLPSHAAPSGDSERRLGASVLEHSRESCGPHSVMSFPEAAPLPVRTSQ